MIFESVSPSAVRSIRQRDFLMEWIRLYRREDALPSRAAFAPARIDEEMPDLMFYNVEYIGSESRYRVTHEGSRLIDAYGIIGIGRHLQDTVSPPVWAYLEPIYRRCVAEALPVYSTFQVIDAQARKVEYERLLLPFGLGRTVESIVASLKPICEDGRFVNADLMSPVNHDPRYTLRAVIAVGLSLPSRHLSVMDDVVEI